MRRKASDTRTYTFLYSIATESTEGFDKFVCVGANAYVLQFLHDATLSKAFKKKQATHKCIEQAVLLTDSKNERKPGDLPSALCTTFAHVFASIKSAKRAVKRQEVYINGTYNPDASLKGGLGLNMYYN